MYVLRLETDDVTPDPVVHPSLLLYQQEDKKKCVISWALGFLFAAYVYSFWNVRTSVVDFYCRITVSLRLPAVEYHLVPVR
jgi:hypothetical protein